MISAETLARFAKTNMAWLTSDGDVLACALHGHMERLETVPAFEEAYRRYRDICDGNDAAMRQDLDSLGPGEHPAMHRFCGMDDDAKDELVKIVYTAGWVRLGRALDLGGIARGDRKSAVAAFRNAGNWYVEAEGLTPALRRHRRALDDIAGALGSRLVIRGMRYQAVNLGSARRPRVKEILVPETHEPAR